MFPLCSRRARHHDARRRHPLRRARGAVFGIALVLVVDGADGDHRSLPCELHALVQTVIQSYSPPEFRGRAIAIFHMNQILLLLGGLVIGPLSAVMGAPWAATALSIAGTLCMVALYIFDPRAREIR